MDSEVAIYRGPWANSTDAMTFQAIPGATMLTTVELRHHPMPFELVSPTMDLRDLLKYTVMDVPEAHHGISGAIAEIHPKTVVTCFENLPINPPCSRIGQDAVAFVAKTEQAKQTLILQGIPELKIYVIGSGVDTTLFTPPLKGRDWPELRILFVGKLFTRKGIYDLLWACAMLRRNKVDFRLTMVGSGSEFINLRNVGECFGISAVTRWEGYIPHHELPEIYRSHDVLVLGSWPGIDHDRPHWLEQEGAVILEAAACGCIPIVSTSGGPGEMCHTHIYLGDIYSPGNWMDLSYKLMKYTIDVRSYMAPCVRRWAETRSSETRAAIYKELYRKIGVQA